MPVKLRQGAEICEILRHCAAFRGIVRQFAAFCGISRHCAAFRGIVRDVAGKFLTVEKFNWLIKHNFIC